jgi:hypothetical protein
MLTDADDYPFDTASNERLWSLEDEVVAHHRPAGEGRDRQG